MVVLVDEHDVEMGTEEKLRVHVDGSLHRAFSVFVFDRRMRLLLQRRARGKYHSGGLWSNTCCGHPAPGESLLDAAHRRLREEMGVVCPLHVCSAFVYKADLGSGLIEHEFDYVLVGRFEGEPTPDPLEVETWKWEALDQVRRDILAVPGIFTVWFNLALEQVAIPSRWFNATA